MYAFFTTASKASLVLIGSVLLFLLSASIALAGDYVSLSGIGQVSNYKVGEAGGLSQFLNVVFIMVISIGALLAVIKIALGGVKYSMSDVVTNKEDAKKDIQGAVLGLLILFSTYIVLNQINPQLTGLDFLTGARTLDSAILPSTVANVETVAARTNADNVLICNAPAAQASTCRNECSALNGTMLPGSGQQNRYSCLLRGEVAENVRDRGAPAILAIQALNCGGRTGSVPRLSYAERDDDGNITAHCDISEERPATWNAAMTGPLGGNHQVDIPSTFANDIASIDQGAQALFATDDLPADGFWTGVGNVFGGTSGRLAMQEGLCGELGGRMVAIRNAQPPYSACVR